MSRIGRRWTATNAMHVGRCPSPSGVQGLPIPEIGRMPPAGVRPHVSPPLSFDPRLSGHLRLACPLLLFQLLPSFTSIDHQ
jgi:hypothetical protein